jgi:putative membrane protein
MIRRRMALVAVSAGAALPLLPVAARDALATQDGTRLGGRRYRWRTLQIGTLAKLTSEIALELAQNPWVKQFAGFEVAEQTTLAEVLTDRPAPGTPSIKLTAEQQQALAHLRSLAAGITFDRAYVEAQILGHQELLALQEEYLATGRNRDLIHIAKLARTVIKEHLTHLGDLRTLLAQA